MLENEKPIVQCTESIKRNIIETFWLKMSDEYNSLILTLNLVYYYYLINRQT